VAQGVGPEFKLQYHKEERKKIRWGPKHDINYNFYALKMNWRHAHSHAREAAPEASQRRGNEAIVQIVNYDKSGLFLYLCQISR
jgi:hypothetical protein